MFLPWRRFLSNIASRLVSGVAWSIGLAKLASHRRSSGSLWSYKNQEILLILKINKFLFSKYVESCNASRLNGNKIEEKFVIMQNVVEFNWWFWVFVFVKIDLLLLILTTFMQREINNLCVNKFSLLCNGHQSKSCDTKRVKHTRFRQPQSMHFKPSVIYCMLQFLRCNECLLVAERQRNSSVYVSP